MRDALDQPFSSCEDRFPSHCAATKVRSGSIVLFCGCRVRTLNTEVVGILPRLKMDVIGISVWW